MTLRGWIGCAVVAVALVTLSPVSAWPQQGGTAAAGRQAFLRGDYATARRILEPLADSGDADAQYWIGVMYAHGKGFPTVCRQAIRWYEKAARQGNVEAAFSAGFMLYHGWGTEEDECVLPGNPERAAPWLKQAAEAGNPRAEFLVARMYATGRGLARSTDEAFDWMRKAAESGLVEAQYELGLMYADGGDRVDAWAWFALLAERGYPGAEINRGRLAANMTEEQLAEAQAKADVLRAAR